MRIIRLLYLKMLAKFFPAAFIKKVGVKIGKNTRIAGDLYKMFNEEAYLIRIGDNCLISSELTILTHDGSVGLFRDEFPHADKVQPVIIGNGVFIGHRCIIMPGVTIGDNVLIGAGSVVSKDIPANSGVYAGVPAKFIKSMEDYKQKVIPYMIDTWSLTKEEKRKFLTDHYKMND